MSKISWPARVPNFSLMADQAIAVVILAVIVFMPVIVFTVF